MLRNIYSNLIHSFMLMVRCLNLYFACLFISFFIVLFFLTRFCLGMTVQKNDYQSREKPRSLMSARVKRLPGKTLQAEPSRAEPG